MELYYKKLKRREENRREKRKGKNRTSQGVSVEVSEAAACKAGIPHQSAGPRSGSQLLNKLLMNESGKKMQVDPNTWVPAAHRDLSGVPAF